MQEEGRAHTRRQAGSYKQRSQREAQGVAQPMSAEELGCPGRAAQHRAGESGRPYSSAARRRRAGTAGPSGRSLLWLLKIPAKLQAGRGGATPAPAADAIASLPAATWPPHATNNVSKN